MLVMGGHQMVVEGETLLALDVVERSPQLKLQ